MRAVNSSAKPHNLSRCDGLTTTLTQLRLIFFSPISSLFLFHCPSTHSSFLSLRLYRSPSLVLIILSTNFWAFSELHHEIILPAIVSPLLPVSECSQSANWNGELLIGMDPQESRLWGISYQTFPCVCWSSACWAQKPIIEIMKHLTS